MVRPSANAVVANAWLRPSAAAFVSFAVTGPTVTMRPETVVLIALRSRLARSKRVVPSRAVSFGAGAVSIVKSLTVTDVDPLVSVSPPLWVMLPASVLASTLPPVIGKARLPSGLAVAGAAGAAAMPSEVSACAVPGSSASEVAPPVKAIWPGVALTVAVPMRRPRVNALTPKALLRAAAPFALSLTATPETVVPSPARATFALASESENAVRRALPALTDSDGVLSTPIVKLVRRTRVAPARSGRPPLWVLVPAAVAGSIRRP